MRELTNAMRQLRVAAGMEKLADAAVTINAAIDQLYPGVAPARSTHPGRRSTPHRVTAQYLSDLERGNKSRLDPPHWLGFLANRNDERTRSGIVPPWLVRAYDLAFAADGYLIDMYGWAVALLTDHTHNPPRAVHNLPSAIPPGGEREFLGRYFTEAPQAITSVLVAEAEALARLPRYADEDSEWLPDDADSSSSRGEGEVDVPEGTLVRPGQYLLGRWVLRNAGTVPWTHRLLFRVGQSDTGLRTPALVTVPYTAPGAASDLRCPIRAPKRPGTYRLCMKMGWPNGVYCFPNTLVGVIFTVTVPPADLQVAYERWSVR